jgi:phosphatidylglycerophosphatase C
VAHDLPQPAAEDVLPRCSAAELIERLAAARARVPAGARALLAFDADNTIWDGDVGVDMFEALLAEDAVRPAAAPALDRLARKHGVGVGLSPLATARALYESWERQLSPCCPEDEVFAMQAWIYAGFTEAELVAFSERVLGSAGVHDRIRPEVRRIVAWAHANDVEVLAVSASPRTPVEVGVRSIDIRPSSVFAMTSKIEAGVLLPELTGVFMYAEGKATAVREGRPGAVLLGGFGDSAWDAALMRLSAVPVAITPGPGLLRAAKGVPGLVELEIASPGRALGH